MKTKFPHAAQPRTAAVHCPTGELHEDISSSTISLHSSHFQRLTGSAKPPVTARTRPQLDGTGVTRTMCSSV